jgi:RHS repeat-associated protein
MLCNSNVSPPERKYVGISATLWANGEAVAVNRYDTNTFTGGTVYLGKDALGSVRGATNDYGLLEDRYEYDAFGKPYKGDLNSGMNFGYTGKPYDTTTDMYNYGYRDYKPEFARFTTIDPIRDRSNWFVYVNNDPVNWVDLWGLAPRNMTEAEREAYMAEISSYSAYDSTSNKMDVPDKSNGVKMDCADVATYLYGQAMEAAGTKTAGEAIGTLQAGGTSITESTLSNIGTRDYAPSQTNNITFYDDKSFNNPNVEVGTVAVWSGSPTGGSGHMATVVGVQRDANGNVTSIETIEGHLTRATEVDKTNTTQAMWNQYSARGETFYGFGEIGKNSTIPLPAATPSPTVATPASGKKGK